MPKIPLDFFLIIFLLVSSFFYSFSCFSEPLSITNNLPSEHAKINSICFSYTSSNPEAGLQGFRELCRTLRLVALLRQVSIYWDINLFFFSSFQSIQSQVTNFFGHLYIYLSPLTGYQCIFGIVGELKSRFFTCTLLDGIHLLHSSIQVSCHLLVCSCMKFYFQELLVSVGRKARMRRLQNSTTVIPMYGTVYSEILKHRKVQQKRKTKLEKGWILKRKTAFICFDAKLCGSLSLPLSFCALLPAQMDTEKAVRRP